MAGRGRPARINRALAETNHEDAAYDLYVEMKRKVDRNSPVRTNYNDVLGLNDEQFLDAWQNQEGFKDRFQDLVADLEARGGGFSNAPKVQAYRLARNQVVNRVVAGSGLVQHWGGEPQNFIGVGYQPTDTDEQRNSAAQILDRRTRPVTATSALSELADVDGGLEREHKVLRLMHAELRADPKLGEPNRIDERNEALQRIFSGGTATPQASQVLTTAKPKDLIEAMGDVQRMRAIRTYYKGTWPFKGGAPAPAEPTGPVAPKPGGGRATCGWCSRTREPRRTRTG